MKNNNIEIVFENNDVLILNKPSGIAVLSGKEETKESSSLINEVKKNLNKNIIPITSLDIDATGIVLFAKNKTSYDFISKQIKDNKIEKTFYILVNGNIQEEKGTIDKPIIVDSQQVIVSEKGIMSHTKYIVKEKFRDFTFLEVNPLTSRRNQIRAHFFSIGNPLAIDNVYASSEPILLSALKRRYKGIKKENPLLKRLPLHFAKIQFVLPNQTQKSVFEIPLPKDMELTLKQLRKYNRSFS
ncbi:MAG: RNA pseudouridine synthase [Endomicrobiaceae bacterium]|nr:RNA pseudouridine synthase [Endomicrobiaceae bacterium]